MKAHHTYEEKTGQLIKSVLEGNVRVFLSDVLSGVYDLGYESLDREQLASRDAWFTKNYMGWMENKGLDAKVLVIDSEEKGVHIVPYVMGFTVDFTFKHILEKDQEEFTVATIGDYISLGYQVEEMSIFNEFPEWIDSFYPPKNL